MSNQKISKVTKKIPYTAVYSSGMLTITTTEQHYLLAGNSVNIHGDRTSLELTNKQVISVVDMTSFTVEYSDESHVQEYLKGTIEISTFNTGVSGRIISPLGRTTGSPIVVQSFVSGAGGAGYDLELSLDGIHWVAAVTVAHALVDGDSEFNTIDPSWAFMAINITSIGSATSLEVLYSA